MRQRKTKTIELQCILLITSSAFRVTSSRDVERIYSGVHDIMACL